MFRRFVKPSAPREAPAVPAPAESALALLFENKPNRQAAQPPRSPPPAIAASQPSTATLPAPAALAEPELEGLVEELSLPQGISGWARDTRTGQMVEVIVRLDGQDIGSASATAMRSELGACGFSVTTTTRIPVGAVLEDRLRVIARCGASEILLKLDDEVTNFCRTAQGLGRFLRDYDAGSDTMRRRFEQQIAALPSVAPHAEQLPALFQFLESSTPVAQTMPDHGVSPVGLPVGAVSPDGVAILGRQGWAYLHGERDSVLRQFQQAPDSEAVTAGVAGWLNLMRARRQRLEAMGITYRQVVIPEKISAVPEHYPGTLRVPSALLAQLERAAAADTELAQCYISTLAGLRGISGFRKLDTNLNPAGAYLVTALLLQSLGEPPMEAPFFQMPQIMAGNLGECFFRQPLYETVAHSLNQYPDATLVERHDPPGEVRTGSTALLRNAEASSQRSVLLLGGAEGELTLGQISLSWWVSRCFRGYRFLWSTNFDFDRITAWRPDVVIGQTTERGLRVLPAS
jgi:alginate O-acetyltransferase complex protein AlgJ